MAAHPTYGSGCTSLATRILLTVVLCGAISSGARAEGPAVAIQQMLVAGNVASADSAAQLLVAATNADTASLARAEALDLLVEARLKGGTPRDSVTFGYASRAVRIRDRLQPRDPALATSLEDLSDLRENRGEIGEAIALQLRAVSIRERATSPDHHLIARSLTDLARSYFNSQQIASALATAVRAESVWRLVPDPDSAEMVGTYLNHAIALNELGDYAGARAMYEYCLPIWERVEGPEGRDVARVVYSLAGVLRRLGGQVESIPLYRRAREMFAQGFGPGSPPVGSAYNGEGNAEREIGHFARAESLYREAKRIWVAKLPPVSPDMARIHDNLGYVEFEQGRLDSARADYQRSLDLWTKLAEGADNAASAHVLDDLGQVEHAQRNYPEARRDYERALAMRLATLGHGHPDCAQSYDALSGLLVDMSEPDSAFRAALEAERISREHLAVSLAGLSEREALEYASIRASGIDLAIQLAASGAVGGRVADAWDAEIRSRCLVLDGISERYRDAWGSGDSVLVRLARKKATTAGNLAHLREAGPDDDETETHFEARVDSVRAQVEMLDRRLGTLSARYAQASRAARAGLAEVRAALPPQTALLAFCRYWRREPTSAPGPTIADRKAAYAVFVMRSDSEPKIVALADAATVDGLVGSWAREVVSTRASTTAGLAAYTASAGRLRAAVWDPVARALAGAKRVFVVLDGSLHRVHLGALTVEDGRYLEETAPVLEVLTSEQDLVRRASGPQVTGRGLLAIGGVDFDASPGAPRPAAEGPLALRGFRGVSPDCEQFRRERFVPLDQSAIEVDTTVSAWRRAHPRAGATAVLALRGAAATEGAFKREGPGREYIHLATHGFFLGESCGKETGKSEPQIQDARLEFAPSQEANPLRRSGLVLAGANRRADRKRGEDGILTAEEIATLNLNGTRCVVLSACESAVGDMQSGEGMLGLRRAFQLAGARSQVASLWRVDDLETRMWIEAFDDAYFNGPGDVALAAHRACLTILASRRSQGLSIHPKSWGAFVAIGE